MAQIIGSPYKPETTLGETLSGTIDSFFGPKASQAAYTREKYLEAKTQRENLPLLVDAVKRGDPRAIAEFGLMSGTTKDQAFGYNAGVRTIENPDTLTSNPVTAALIAGGTNMSATPQGVFQHNKMLKDIEDNKLTKLFAADQLKNDREQVFVLDSQAPPGSALAYISMPRSQLMAEQAAAVQGGRTPRYNVVAPFDITKAAEASRILPTLDPNDRKTFIGANAPDDKALNWVAPPEVPGGPPRQGTTVDRRFDFTTGLPLPAGHQLYTPGSQGGANSMTSALGGAALGDIDAEIMHGENSIKLMDRIIPMVEKNKSIVGLPGSALRLAQNATDVVSTVHQMFGGEAQYKAEVAKAKQAATQLLGADAVKVLPGLFSSDLNTVGTLHALLTYEMARAKNKGSLAIKDVSHMAEILGDPNSLMQSPSGFLDKMNAAREQTRIELEDNTRRRNQRRSGVNPDLANPAAARGGAAAPAPGGGPPPGFVLD